MSISIPMESVYLPCYYHDAAAGSVVPGRYNYTETLKKAAEGAKDQTRTYWEPDEYGRVFIDPEHPWTASLEPAGPADDSSVRLPAACCGLPSNRRTEETGEKDEERRVQEERLRMFREERERMARMEAVLHRLAQSLLAAERG